MHRSTLYWLRAEYRQTGLAQDASAAIMMRNAMGKLSRRWRKKFDVLAAKLAERFAVDVMNNSDASLATALQQAGFTVPFKMTAEMNNVLQATLNENVILIRAIPQHYFTQVETRVMQSVSHGRDLGTLTKALQQHYGVARRRAAFIALDQNNKATSAMQAARQRALGMTHGRWCHSHAGKVPRPSHVKADGQIFDLAKGLYLDGKWVMPGEEINCRCTWEAILPGLE